MTMADPGMRQYLSFGGASREQDRKRRELLVGLAVRKAVVILCALLLWALISRIS
jgi:hypothetical protein